MRRLLLLLALVVSPFVLAGCASSSGAAADSATRTREMTLRVPLSYGTGEVTAAALRLAVTAEAECLTVDPCDVRGLRLTFLNRSTRGVRLRFIPVQILAGAQRFDAPTPNVDLEQEFVPNGAFFSPLLPREFVDAFAREETVTIRFGQTEVTLNRNERQPVRDLLAQMQGATP